ncbi:serine/threonine-protein kinase SMG1-like [Tachypleus tridentatus]|uniref:serine/threonine-protein kinase SMG1-like n=1 Tax=Tachypleus tridentatus TaxID=6853 RepID=UPI003FD5420F
MIRQVLGLPSQAVTFALCSLMGSLGVDVTAEIEQKDIGAESKVSLDDLSNKVVDRYVKDKFPSGQLSQTSSLTSALDTVWRKWDLARRLEKHDVLLKESVQRVQLQLARYHWLFEDILAQGNVGPLQNLTAYGRSTLMSEMRKAVQTLLSLESAVSQSQDRYLSVTASVEQRLKWAAGANPSLASTQEEFEAGITEKTATTSATAQLSRELMNVCNAILHFEAMRTRTSEALASDSSFLNLINRLSQESCLLAANCVSQVTKLEEHLIDLQPLPETGGITSDWITSILEKISQSLAKSKEKLEQKEVESFSHWDVVKNHVILIRSLLTTHYNLMTDVRSILKSLAKHEEVALKEEDQQIVPVQQYLLKYRSFSEQISAMVREVLSDVCEHDPHKVNKIREKLAPLPSLTVDVYDGLIELAGPVGSHSHPVFTCIISDATAGKNPNYQKVRGERTVVGKKMLPPSVRDGDLYSEPSPGSQGAGSRPLSTPIPDKNKKSNVFRDPKTGKVVQERNSYATNVWRRVKVKLDGKDPDLNRRLSVAEQTKCPSDSESCLMPPSKKSKSETDSSRSFQEKWLNEFNWLKYEASTKQMFCTLCIKVQNSNTFTTGCAVMKKDNLTKHQKTKDHRDAMEASKLSTAMTKATVSAINKSETAIIAAMHNVYFAAKHDLRSSLILDLNRLWCNTAPASGSRPTYYL